MQRIALSEFAQAGDHDDRHVAGTRLGLEPQQQLVAIHLRHDEVEQDDVERLAREQLECRAARVGAATAGQP